MQYVESHFAERGRIRYTLTAETLEIASRGSCATIQLQGLEPDFVILRFRSPAFYVGLVGMILGSIAGLVGAAGWLDAENSRDFVALAIIVGVISLLCVIPSWRKVERAVFRSTMGPAAIAIARAGPDSDKFHDFVDELARRIRSVQASEGVRTR